LLNYFVSSTYLNKLYLIIIAQFIRVQSSQDRNILA
jgi:hypothetical protein